LFQQDQAVSEFIDMCDSLEKFVGGGVESPLSSQTRDRLQEYTGTRVKIPSTSLTRPSLAFSTFIEKLRKENYVMFSVDAARYANEK
jgi:hypothetical protein